MEIFDMDRSDLSYLPGAEFAFGSRDKGRGGGDSAARADLPDEPVESGGGTKIRRLIAGQLYFGLEARALHAGAQRVLARIAAQAPAQARIDIRSLGHDFCLDDAATWTLVRALLAARLVYPDGTGGYPPTARFREYAVACVVAPLSRARAKTLVAKANETAERINASWAQNPYQIEEIAVSGSYISRCDPLPELSLWLVLRKRPETRGRRPSLPKDEALHQIVAAIKAISSFVVVRVVADRQAVQRPFNLIYEGGEHTMDHPGATWEKLREWGASIGHRLVSK
jgi:hypothetical protein